MTNRPTAEICAIGSELLSGDTVDTNSSDLAQALRAIGIELRFISAVGDDEYLIAKALEQGMARSDVVLTTGGLGPTVDDKTRAAVARATGRSLILHQELLDQIEARFTRWGRCMTRNNLRQAYTPSGALPIENPVGTAPCFIVEHGHSQIICLPGVPHEMSYLLKNAIVPYLRRQFPSTEVVKMKILHTVGVGESILDDKIGDLEALENPVVGLAAHQGVVDIRITARADDENAADELIARVEGVARQRLGNTIYGSDGDSLARGILDRLKASSHTISAIESGTRGELAKKLALADDGRYVFMAGLLLPKCTVISDIEHALRKNVGDCLVTHSTDLCIASMVIYSDEGIKIGVAVGRAASGSTETRVHGYGGHADYAGELGANLALNLLRTQHA